MELLLKKMRAKSLLKVLLIFFPCFFMKIISTFAAAPKGSSACILSFRDYPYEPDGECLRPTEEILAWGTIWTNRCCRTALITLSQALARYAHNNDTIFLPASQWQECELPVPQNSSISIKSCGFRNLYQGSNKCSNLTISDLKTEYPAYYNSLVGNCHQFPHPSFDQACRSCTEEIENTRDQLMKQLLLDGADEDKAVCGLALVILVAAAKIDDPSWVNDFFSCLPALDRKDVNYFKIKRYVAKAILIVLIVTMGLLLVILLTKYVYKKRKPAKKPQEEVTNCSGLYRFSIAEIESAMSYSNRVSLGKGSTGWVYKGVLPSGQVVAIKHIYKSGISESFTTEVEVLSTIRHPNLVCLFGCCADDGELYLVFEYCPCGNLAQQLLRRDSVLSWDKRVRILRDCALALRFLHNYPCGRIVHRDIKLTNILLTEDLEPKLSDFNLAKILGIDESRVFTQVKGTTGYMDPEYVNNAELTCSSDVYSFGIVTLQILSGKSITKLDVDARNHLIKEAKDVISGNSPLSHFEDPRLNGNLNKEAFLSILNLANVCIANSSKGRPTMNVVYDELDNVWKNMVGNMMARVRSEVNSSMPSTSSQVIEV